MRSDQLKEKNRKKLIQTEESKINRQFPRLFTAANRFYSKKN
jgi:hypothetical protein